MQSLCDRDIIIYRWTPHGSKKLDDLSRLERYNLGKKTNIAVTKPPMICHDQEPLNIDYWSTDDFVNHTTNGYESLSVANQFATWHLRTALGPHKMHVFTKTMLCHSELNSAELEKYEQKNFVGVYYWSHALIARDWFRYAQVDPVIQEKNICQDFLIYNRAWSGTREYRLKFAELVAKHHLDQHCRMGFNPIDGINYRDHVFKNPKLQIANSSLDKHFVLNTASANASADYCNLDYKETALEVVLETLFDDTRWHLTEKTLRPIACGQPFILLSSPGSLEYLRKYGFKTFDSIIDESYDSIQDPLERIHAVIDLMQNIQQNKNKTIIYQQLSKIAKHNQRRFFSDEFHKQLVDEFQYNFTSAYTQVIKSCSPTYFETYLNAIIKTGDYNKLTTEQERQNSGVARQFVYDFIKQTQVESNMHSNPVPEDFSRSP